jgi:glycosyltransferase involved in cell wall biosynthesis
MHISDLETSDIANLLLYQPLRLFELFYTKKISGFISVSESVKQELINYLNVPKEKIRTIYHGIDTDRFHPKASSVKCPIDLPSDRPIILFTGRFVATKGLNTIIKAIQSVIKVFPDALFVFVGGGNFKHYYSYLAGKGVPQRNFLFHGYVNDYYDLPSVYSRSNIVIAPTIYEPLGFRILEAMSCAKPVIASRIGGIPEIIDHGKNGLLISSEDHLELTNSIISLLEDYTLMKSIGKNARKTVLDKFSVDRMAMETLKFYDLFNQKA